MPAGANGDCAGESADASTQAPGNSPRLRIEQLGQGRHRIVQHPDGSWSVNADFGLGVLGLDVDSGGGDEFGGTTDQLRTG